MSYSVLDPNPLSDLCVVSLSFRRVTGLFHLFFFFLRDFFRGADVLISMNFNVSIFFFYL